MAAGSRNSIQTVPDLRKDFFPEILPNLKFIYIGIDPAPAYL